MNRPVGNISLVSDLPIHIQWQIPDYFTVPQETSRIFISSNFPFMHTEWRLALVASGTPGWIRLRLLWDGSTATTRYYRISFNMGICRHDGSVFRSWTGVGDPQNRDWGPAQLVLRSELHAAEGVVAPDGLLKVFCILTAEKIEENSEDYAVSKEEVQSSETSKKIDTSQNVTGVDKLLQNFKDLMRSGDESDISLMVQDQEFKSHKAVLSARSPVFAAMLKHSMKEKDSGVVEVQDCDPVAFKYFLEHLYTGNVEELSEDCVFGLYRIADKYDTPDLKAKCLDFISGCLSTETFCDVVTLAAQHEESELLEKAITFFSKNMREVIATPKWQEFLKQYTETGNEILLEALDRTSKSTKK